MRARRPLFYFIGDSLTQDGSNVANGGWVAQLQQQHVRSVDTINRGLSGYNTRWFIELALPVFEEELKSQFAPSLVTLWLGANDAALLSGGEAYQHVPLETFRANLALIVRALAAQLPPAHGKLLVITPGAVIDRMRLAHSASGSDLDRCDEAAAAYARVCVEVAAAEGVAVLDLHARLHAAFPDEAARAALFTDGLHFTPRGHAVVAQEVAGAVQTLFSAEELARFDAWQLPDFHSLIARDAAAAAAASK
ncbi:hypothetical protein PybrP1_001374 [[Pythium] brassicae (nom. inval.)]|nr:hypothetical protein PybrP1_001374 [[Pythium] brassicae (nom. inval.)]